MEVSRIFHPVGQGGFYTESFDDNHIVVYDCGGKSQDFINRYIDSFLPEETEQQIDAIFISHLHWDHVNGLECLLKKSKQHCRIFIPEITRAKIFEYFFYNVTHHYHRGGLSANDFIAEFLSESLKNETLIEVEEWHPEQILLHEAYELDSTYRIPQRIPSGSILSKRGKWMYIPFNLPLSEPVFENIDEANIRRELRDIYDMDYPLMQARMLKKFVTQHSIKECLCYYKKLFGGIHNAQSMTVFAGLSETDRLACKGGCINHNMCEQISRIISDFCVVKNEKVNIIPCNFLYTGDYEAQSHMNDLCNFYNLCNVWKTINGVQTPHHGSRNNYDDNLYKERTYAIVSVSDKSPYHHPHIDVLRNIMNQKCVPLVVTDNANTKIYQYFKIQ